MRINSIPLVIFHVILQIPGIATLAHYLAELVRRAWETSHHIDGLAAWALQPQPPKIENILEYIILVVIGASLILSVFIYSRRDRGYVEIHGWWLAALSTYELTSLFISLGHPNLLIGWLVLAILFPIWVHFRHQTSPSMVTNRIHFVITCAILGFVFWTLAATSWNKDLRFINDYTDFPEYTRMSDGSLVENGAFMRTHHIHGWFKSYPFGGQDETSPNLCIHLSKTVFRNASEPFILFPPGSGLVYNWESETLLSYRPLSEKEKVLVQSLWVVKRKDLERDNVPQLLYNQSSNTKTNLSIRPYSSQGQEFIGKNKNEHEAQLHVDVNTRPYSPQVQEFLGKNKNELDAQLQLGRFFYHHAYLYLPALERAAFPGDRITQTQYGEGLSWTIGALISNSGLPTFQAYYTVFWWGLYVYLVLLGFVTWWITRDGWACVLSVCVAISVILTISNDAFRMAPGFNPIRHFPDLLCLLAVAYNARRHTPFSALIRAATIGALLWWNREFGLFFLGASVTWLIFEASLAKGRGKKRNIAQLALETIIALAVLVSISSNSVSDLARYNLIGIGAPITRWRDVFGWLTLWTPLIVCLLWLRFFSVKAFNISERRYLLDVAGVGVIYATLTTIYVLWNPSPNHAAVVWLCAVVPLTSFVFWMLEVVTRDKVEMCRFAKYISTITVGILAGMMIANQTVYKQFEKIFENHQLMYWNFPSLIGTSTAHPGIMEESVKLIEKFQPKGRILLISRFDSLLQILVNRPTILPYVELPGAVVSQDMINKISSHILQSNMPILFVDRDLLEEREWQLIRDQYGDSDSGATLRVASLAALGQVFLAISHCYVPGETSGALQVWHRNCGIEKP